MKDSILKGTGNSRFLKSAIPAGTSWESALAMLRSGSFPIDLNGINTDGFQQVGTALNKRNLLQDEATQLIGLGEANPADMFWVFANCGELFVWDQCNQTDDESAARYVLVDASTTELGYLTSSQGSFNGSVCDAISVDDYGNIKNATNSYSGFSIGYSTTTLPATGKFLFEPAINNQSRGKCFIQKSEVFYIPDDAEIVRTYSSTYSGYSFKISKLKKVIATPRLPAQYLHARYRVGIDRSTLQDGLDDDGNYNKFIGQLGSALNQSFTYEGIGFFGADSPNSFTFEFEPRIVIITSRSQAMRYSDSVFAVFVSGMPTAFVVSDGGQSVSVSSPTDIVSAVSLISVNFQDATLTFYAETDKNQLNQKGITYSVVAFG